MNPDIFYQSGMMKYIHGPGGYNWNVCVEDGCFLRARIIIQHSEGPPFWYSCHCEQHFNELAVKEGPQRARVIPIRLSREKLYAKWIEENWPEGKLEGIDLDAG